VVAEQACHDGHALREDLMIRTRADYDDVLAFLNRQDTRRHPHRLPMERYAWSDCEFFFTICARQHDRPFANPLLAQAIIDALLWRKQRHGWYLFCYCLMPDHLHFIVKLLEASQQMRQGGIRGVESEGILHQVADFKSYTTSQLWWPGGGTGALWQESSYDRVIRFNDSVEQAVNYTLNNPVRKGLVEEWSQYPYARIVDFA
jgi:REP element-mobilizing transposase RayT